MKSWMCFGVGALVVLGPAVVVGPQIHWWPPVVITLTTIFFGLMQIVLSVAKLPPREHYAVFWGLQVGLVLSIALSAGLWDISPFTVFSRLLAVANLIYAGTLVRNWYRLDRKAEALLDPRN